MRSTYETGRLVAMRLCGAILGASCTINCGGDESGSTRAAGTNATGDAGATCGVDVQWRTWGGGKSW